MPNLSSIFSSVSSFVKLHEKLLAVVVASAMAFGVVAKVQDAIAAHDQKVYAARTADLQAQVAANAAQAQANAKLAADYQALAQKVQTQNAALEATNAKLVDALKQQQVKDATLPSPELAQRVETLAHLTPDSLAPVVGADAFVIQRLGLVSIAQELEVVPVLTAQVQNLQTQKGNLETQLASQGALAAGLNTQVAGLQSEIEKAKAANNAEVKAVKAQANKAKRKWAIVGFIAGATVRGAVKLLTGI